jgi:membrane dipeptidase
MRKRMFETVRELRKKHPEERDFQAALAQYRKDNPIPKGTIHDVVDHVEHIIRVAGIDHVGLGSDYDGIDSAPEQLEDVSKYPWITQELLNRGYTKEQILKVLGGNLMRVFREAERPARMPRSK